MSKQSTSGKQELAHGLGEHPQHVYSVSFTALELWGTPRPDNVYIDLWDDYLEEA